jgi:peptidoglycan/LPS O-acetylase OafA/YrhL
MLHKILQLEILFVNLFPIFILKRLARLEPPYLASILLVVVLNFISERSSSYQGLQHTYDFYRILSHLGYLSDLFGFRWLNPVYWTLAIELQFYLLLGLVFPFLIYKSNIFYLVFFLLICSCLFFNYDGFIFKYLPYFLIGIIACLFFNKRISIIAGLILFIVLLIYIYIFGEGISHTITSIITIICIFWLPLGEIGFLNFLGKISYSLYLTHIPIGMRIINFGARYSQNSYILQISILIFAVVVSLLTALMLYQFIEKPSISLSKKIKFPK